MLQCANLARTLTSCRSLHHYSTLTSADVEHFQSLLGDNGALTQDLDFYNEDWLGMQKGESKLVLRPRSTGEVSDILKYCNARHLPIVPQGGNTGLVFGSTPIKDEVVLSLQRMNNITDFDSGIGAIQCQAGTVLQHIEDYAGNYDFSIPLDLGSKGSCTIGGNLSTHAGGLRIVRYGRLRGSVLGLKVVLADGTILDDMTTMRKDNTGYDIKQLFIGGEGTLGVITEASLLLPPAPKSINLVMFGCKTFTDVVNICNEAKKQLGEIIAACEYMDDTCMLSVVDNLNIPYPMEEHYPFYFIAQTFGMNPAHDQEKLEDFVEGVFAQGHCADGIIAASRDQVKKTFALRENIAVGLKPLGHNYQYDVSVPAQRMEELVEDIRARVQQWDNVEVASFGHIGDNDIHVHVIAPPGSDDVLSAIEPYIYERVTELGGSISSEHGIGSQKAAVLPINKKEPLLNTMKLLKGTLDPRGILNPNKILLAEQ